MMLDKAEIKVLDLLNAGIALKLKHLRKLFGLNRFKRKSADNRKGSFYIFEEFPDNKSKLIFYQSKKQLFFAIFLRKCDITELPELLNEYKRYFKDHQYKMIFEDGDITLFNDEIYRIEIKCQEKDGICKITITESFDEKVINEIDEFYSYNL